jgi:hypothetical protein
MWHPSWNYIGIAVSNLAPTVYSLAIDSFSALTVILSGAVFQA